MGKEEERQADGKIGNEEGDAIGRIISNQPKVKKADKQAVCLIAVNKITLLVDLLRTAVKERCHDILINATICCI